MRTKKIILGLTGILLIGIIICVEVSGALFGTAETPTFNNPTTNWQYSQPNFNNYYPTESTAGGQIGIYDMWPILRDIENEQCEATSDFLVSIRPGSCTPAVVRSDLLEEQNVPVYCQLDAVRVNPLIKTSSIKSISFKGDYPEGVAGISFHPARAAVRSYNTLLGSPLLNNIGYVVIILEKNKVEEKMPDWVAGNLTATIYYDAENVYGTGKGEYYLPVVGDDEWENNYKDSGFWYGRGYLRVKDIEEGYAKISIYTDKENVFREITLQEGKTSSLMYFPGFYCKAGLKVKLNKIVAPEKQALLNIDGQSIWVREGSNVLDKCRVNSIGALGDKTGSISITCPGQKIDLILQKAGAKISVDGVEQENSLGEKVFAGNTKVWYLGYSGKVPNNVKESAGKNFVVLIDSDKEIQASELGQIAERVSEVETDGKEYNTIKEFEKKLGSYSGLFGGNKVYVIVDEIGIDTKKIIFKGFAEKSDKTYEPILEDYFGKANKTVDELVEDFGAEGGLVENYGETALLEQARLAEELGKFAVAEALYNKFLEKYPDSKNALGVRESLSQIGAYDFSKAYASVFVNNNHHTIRVDSFKAVDKNAKRAKISAGNFNDLVNEGDKIGLGGKPENTAGTDYILINEINVDDVKVSYYKYVKDSSGKSSYESPVTKILKGKDSYNFEGNEVVIREIFVDKVAYVSLIPEIKNTKTEADFTFRVGIEKRAIELSPEKTKEMIKNLNETIAEWEEITEKLGNLIKGWKGACFATSSLLMMKTLMSGFDGETMARQKVMERYRAECDSNPAYKGMSHTECYNKLSSQISSDVGIVQNNIKAVNDDVGKIDEANKINEGWFGLEKVVNSEKSLADYKTKFKELHGKTVKITVDGQVKELNIDSINSMSQLREADLMMRLEKTGASDIVKKGVKENVDSQLGFVWQIQEAERKKKEIENQYSIKDGSEVVKIPVSVLATGQGNLFYDKTGEMSKTKLGNIVSDKNNNDFKTALGKVKGENVGVMIVGSGAAQYLVLMQPVTKQGDVQQVGIFEVSQKDNKLVLGEKKTSLPLARGVGIISVSGGDCKNKFLNPKVRFYETSPNVKLPAIVPFDIEEGWYVKVPQSIGGMFSSQQAGYQASGDVSFFYICNVGSNGMMENMKGDDLCQSFDVNTYNKVDSFVGCSTMSSAKVQELARKARQAIREASQQYGSNRIRISSVMDTIEVDAPMSGNGELVECQDFMSPEDCKLLFNVCDPVICPPSRCNLGGKWPVANVAQTGIIGSIFLCLPNAKEGILVPICLTGIHAGIDNLVSIMKSERDCLQRSLDTGEHVGICDEITSFYLCEFFWRQFAPVIDILIPKIIESAYGMQGARGGGEYLTVMHAWDTLQKGIDYFKDNYAQNAFRAFNARSTQELGGTFCKMFLGTSVPGSADLIDSLLEPESPEQVYAWFSEVAHSDATVPASSHYKVYYHIYAGNDRGIYYSVYLRDPPASSYYQANPVVQVKNGYIAKGESADEAIDFTAPAGYKEMCVVIDAQTHCGFKQVTTDFALNYLSKKYVEEQADKRQINSEKECISGSPSMLSMVQPNVQAGVEEAVNPQIAMRGIVRVCATRNPGESTEGNKTDSRWTDVGYCDNPNIRCWLDSESVKNDVEQIKSIEGTLSATEEYMKKMENGVLTSEASRAELSILREEVRKLSGITIANVEDKINKTIRRLDILIGGVGGDFGGSIEGRAYSNADIAEALSLKASVYQIVVRQLKPVVSVSEVVEKVVEAVGGVCGNEVIDEGEECDGDDSGCIEKYGLNWGCMNCKCFEAGGDEEELVGSETLGDLFSDYDDSMLDEDVPIVVKNSVLGTEKKYQFNLVKGWISPDALLLKGKGYVEGIIELVKNTNWLGGSIEVKGEEIPNRGNSDVEMAEKVLKVLEIKEVKTEQIDEVAIEKTAEINNVLFRITYTDGAIVEREFQNLEEVKRGILNQNTTSITVTNKGNKEVTTFSNYDYRSEESMVSAILSFLNIEYSPKVSPQEEIEKTWIDYQNDEVRYIYVEFSPGFFDGSSDIFGFRWYNGKIVAMMSINLGKYRSEWTEDLLIKKTFKDGKGNLEDWEIPLIEGIIKSTTWAYAKDYARYIDNQKRSFTIVNFYKNENEFLGRFLKRDSRFYDG